MLRLFFDLNGISSLFEAKLVLILVSNLKKTASQVIISISQIFLEANPLHPHYFGVKIQFFSKIFWLGWYNQRGRLDLRGSQGSIEPEGN